MLLIDAYNVLHTKGVLPPEWAGLEVDGLLRLIACSRYATRQVRLVCDGEPLHDPQLERTTDGTARRRLGWAEVWYAGSHRQADDLLELQMNESSAARRWLVVSSDRRIVRAARRVEASVLSSEQFLAQLVADELRPGLPRLPAFATDIPLDRYSVEHWMRTFGFDPAALQNNAPASSATPSSSQASTLPPTRTPAREPQGNAKSQRPKPAEANLGERLGSLLARVGRAATAAPPAPASQSRPSEASPANAAPGGAVPSPSKSNPSPQAPAGAGTPPSLTLDPLLEEALRAWEGRLTLEELDMTRWLADTLPSPPPAPPPKTPSSSPATPRNSSKRPRRRG